MFSPTIDNSFSPRAIYLCLSDLIERTLPRKELERSPGNPPCRVHRGSRAFPTMSSRFQTGEHSLDPYEGDFL